MNDLKVPLIIFILGLLAIILVGPPKAHGACILAHCKTEAPKKRTYITNTSRQIVGDLYLVPGQRTQIRNKHRQIIGYIDEAGRITNTSRQTKGYVNE